MLENLEEIPLRAQRRHLRDKESLAAATLTPDSQKLVTEPWDMSLVTHISMTSLTRINGNSSET